MSVFASLYDGLTGKLRVSPAGTETRYASYAVRAEITHGR
jgi:hypothetical protein